MQTYNGNEQLRTAAFPGAYITPADASRQIVKWTSDNEDIATVDFAGVVTAKEGAEGSATITATATDGSGVTGSVLINVKDPSQTTVVKNHKFDLLKMTIDITKIVCYTNWRNKAIFLGSDTCGSTE